MNMLYPRRFLPSLSLLSAFEAAGRLGSVTAAAQELSLTQSAVSRQIKALEEQLEYPLFHRERQTIRLTVGGEGYLREVRDALRKISIASLNLRANPSATTLNVSVLPALGVRWLMPRLSSFLASHPGIMINLVTRQDYFDFRLELIDIAFHFGRPEWPGGQLALMRKEQVIPACHPALLERFEFRQAADFRQAPLLHLTTRLRAWEDWLAEHGDTADSVQGMLFDQFSTMIEAAASGLGVAMLPSFLIEDELASGRLVCALNRPMEPEGAYYLVWPTERGDFPALVAFREWVLAESAADR
jgi:LysR family transcriptional regulator, glycine cleavage system transcriptional activator